VANFDKIKARRSEESNKILQEMPSVPVERYINLSEKNMKDKTTFLQILMRDTFFRLYFLDDTRNELLFPIYSLTGAGSFFVLNAQKKQINEHTVSYDCEDNEAGTSCRVVYKFSDLKHITAIKAVVSTKDIDNKEYKKEINIRLNEDSCEVKKSNKFMSNLKYYLS